MYHTPKLSVADLGGGASAACAPPPAQTVAVAILLLFSRALKQALACQNWSSGSKVTGFQILALKNLQKFQF